jgi:hypothetical protein
VAIFHTQVRLDGFDFQDSQFTVLLHAGITTDDIGKAVSQDTSAANTVKLAGDGDEIIGQLLQVEARTVEGHLVGTVGFEFQELLPVLPGLSGAAIVAVGSRICGAGGGSVKAIDPASPPLFYAEAPRVWEVRGTNCVAQSV